MHVLTDGYTPAGDSGDDCVQPFLLESSGIRGRLLRLGPLLETILGRHQDPPAVALIMGEMLALTGALSSLLKFDGVFTLQTKGDGPVSMMVGDVTTDGDLRGYAAFDAERLPPALAEASVPQLLGEGYLAFTVDPGGDSDRYQGIVELQGDRLADCLQHYFLQSEQVQSGILLAARQGPAGWRASALILQRLPEEAAAHGTGDKEASDEDWRRAMILQASCTEAELLDPALPAYDLLYRLFHEEGVRVFKPRPLTAGCRCSRTRLEQVLRTLPQDEVMDLREDGMVVVTCEFCRAAYKFDDSDLAKIYAP